MCVLLTTYLLRGGVLTHVWDLVSHLSEAGVSVNVAVLRRPNSAANKTIHRAKTLPSLVGPIEKVPFIYYETPQELIDFCRRQQIKLIHAHSRLAFPTSLQAARRLNLPLVITLHGVFPWIRYYPTTLQYAKKVIAIGPAQVKGAEPHQEKVEIIPNGIDTIHFCPSMHRSRRISDTLKVLWFGRTDGTSSRGVKVLDQVIKILRTRKIKVDACAIGIPTGVSVVHLKTYGWIDNPVPILQSGHITFGHGRALREAMSCGNIGFLLGHGYGGQVKKSWFTGKSIMPVSAIPEYGLPKPDAEKIASDISRYVNNDALLYRDCLEARDIAVKFFDVRKMIDEIVKVYRNCVLVSTNNGQYSLNRVGLRSQWKS